MAFFKTAAAAVVGVLALSADANARTTLAAGSPGSSTTTNKSSAKCSVVSIGYSEVSSKTAIATAVADASAYICDSGTKKTDVQIADETAEAFAVAVASASAQCDLQGTTNAYVNAHAQAKAAAEVFVQAYAAAWASAGDCEKCGAFVGSFGYVEKYVFLEAVASTGFNFNAYTTAGNKLAVTVLAFKAEVKKVVAQAFAVALAGAKAHKNKTGCAAFVNTGGCIWTPDSPDPEACFECVAEAVSEGKIKEIDAFASAVAKAAAWTCGDHPVIDEDEDSARDVAKAIAKAVSLVYVSCAVEGKGYACADASTYIESTARATATAFAQVWAEAVICHTCKVTIDAFVKATVDIVATAATSAYKNICVSDNDYWTETAYYDEIAKATVTAIADASVAAISVPPHTCVAAGYIDATVH